MSRATLGLSDALLAYCRDYGVREPDLVRALREETAVHPHARMQISPEQGQFLQLLCELIGARRILEVGTFTGYSAIWMAAALPADGCLICCDVSEESTAVARRYWNAAQLSGRIELHLRPALETMQQLFDAGGAESLDLVFIDADKSNYRAYYEQALRLLRPGGVCAIDNVLWSGRVVDPACDDADTVAIRELNALIHADSRVTVSLVPIGDGLTLARKRA